MDTDSGKNRRAQPAIALAILLVFYLVGFQPTQAQELIFADGFESGDLCRWGPAPDCPPQFAGLILAAATDDDELTLRWLEATEDVTPPGEMTYLVYVDQQPSFTPTADNLIATLGGSLQLVAKGFDPGTTYYALAVARDGAGQTSPGRRYLQVSTPQFPTITSADVPLEWTEELGLGLPLVVEPQRLVFQNGEGVEVPTVGGVLVGAFSADGDGFARSVTSVATTNEQVEVFTSETSLDEVVDQYDFAAAAALVEPTEEDEGGLLGRASAVRAQSFPRGSIRQSDFTPRNESGRYLVRHRDLDLGEISVEVDLAFEPSVLIDAEWSLGGLEQARLVAAGEMDFSATVRYEFEGAGSYDPEPVHLFTRSWTSVYVVAGVPIYQRVTMTVFLEMDATATTEITAETTASIGAGIEAGLVFDEGSGWQPISDLSTSRSLEADLEIHGSVDASVRVVPQLEVSFYEALSGRISVEPWLEGSILVEESTLPLCFPVQLQAFDVEGGLDCNVSADLSLFNTVFFGWEAQVCDPSWPLFSLPAFAEPTLVAMGTGPVDVSAGVQDGVNNPLDEDSIVWSVSPSGATLEPGSDPLEATLSCIATSNYQVSFAANGILGPLARRCVSLLVPCEGSLGPVEIIDQTGDGLGNTYQGSAEHSIAVDGAGNVYVGSTNDKVFKIAPDTTITMILDAAGDGNGNTLMDPGGLAVDQAGNLFVVGKHSDNVFRVSADGQISEILDSSAGLDSPWDVAVDHLGFVYVSSRGSNEVYKVSPGGSSTVILDATGDGKSPLSGPLGIEVDGSRNVFVGSFVDLVFRIAPNGVVTEMTRLSPTGPSPPDEPHGIGLDDDGNLYCSSPRHDTTFRIAPTGERTVILTEAGDGEGNTLGHPIDIAVHPDGTAFVPGRDSDNVFRVSPGGTVTEILDSTGAGAVLDKPLAIEVDSSGNVYVSGQDSNNAFLIPAPSSSKDE